MYASLPNRQYALKADSLGFDALFNGPRKDVRPPRCPKNFKNKLQTFETRPPWVIRNENDFNANRNWGAVLEAISFNLHSCMEISMYNEDGNMMPNMNENMLGWTGHTVSNKDDSGDVVVHLAIEAVEPLLDPNITQSERLLTTFLLAKTLVHELCVSQGFFQIRNFLTTATARKHSSHE